MARCATALGEYPQASYETANGGSVPRLPHRLRDPHDVLLITVWPSSGSQRNEACRVAPPLPDRAPVLRKGLLPVLPSKKMGVWAPTRKSHPQRKAGPRRRAMALTNNGRT